MTQKYGKWNNAYYYPNCSRISECQEFSTEKLLYGDPIEIHVNKHYNNDHEFVIGSFESHILLRVGASHGLTYGQLEKYLLLQGLEFEKSCLVNKLYQMTKYGYLTTIILRRTSDNTQIFFYDLAEEGYQYLRKNELLYTNPETEWLTCGDIFRYIRAKIVANQIVLQLLCSSKSFRSFYFQKNISTDDHSIVSSYIPMPLYIQTQDQNYMFEFVGNTGIGRKSFHNRMEKLLSMKDSMPQQMVLILVAETYEHMQMLTTQMLAYEKRGLELDVLYTHDSEWFYDRAGQFYAMARAMGQSGLISIKIL